MRLIFFLAISLSLPAFGNDLKSIPALKRAASQCALTELNALRREVFGRAIPIPASVTTSEWEIERNVEKFGAGVLDQTSILCNVPKYNMWGSRMEGEFGHMWEPVYFSLNKAFPSESYVAPERRTNVECTIMPHVVINQCGYSTALIFPQVNNGNLSVYFPSFSDEIGFDEKREKACNAKRADRLKIHNGDDLGRQFLRPGLVILTFLERLPRISFKYVIKEPAVLDRIGNVIHGDKYEIEDAKAMLGRDSDGPFEIHTRYNLVSHYNRTIEFNSRRYETCLFRKIAEMEVDNLVKKARGQSL